MKLSTNYSQQPATYSQEYRKNRSIVNPETQIESKPDPPPKTSQRQSESSKFAESLPDSKTDKNPLNQDPSRNVFMTYGDKSKKLANDGVNNGKINVFVPYEYKDDVYSSDINNNEQYKSISTIRGDHQFMESFGRTNPFSKPASFGNTRKDEIIRNSFDTPQMKGQYEGLLQSLQKENKDLKDSQSRYIETMGKNREIEVEMARLKDEVEALKARNRDDNTQTISELNKKINNLYIDKEIYRNILRDQKDEIINLQDNLKIYQDQSAKEKQDLQRQIDELKDKIRNKETSKVYDHYKKPETINSYSTRYPTDNNLTNKQTYERKVLNGNTSIDNWVIDGKQTDNNRVSNNSSNNKSIRTLSPRHVRSYKDSSCCYCKKPEYQCRCYNPKATPNEQNYTTLYKINSSSSISSPPRRYFKPYFNEQQYNSLKQSDNHYNRELRNSPQKSIHWADNDFGYRSTSTPNNMRIRNINDREPRDGNNVFTQKFSSYEDDVKRYKDYDLFYGYTRPKPETRIYGNGEYS